VAPWRAVKLAEEMEQKPDARLYDYNLDDVRRKAGAVLFDGEQTALQHQHSHFILVDDGKGPGEKPWGAEIDVRTKLEERICSTVFRDEDDRDLPKPPMVGLVVGGGPGTLGTVRGFLSAKRPVVVLRDSGGAGRDIYTWWKHNTELLSAEEDGPAAFAKLLEEHFDWRVGAAEKGERGTFFRTQQAYDEYLSLLKEVCREGREKRGANKLEQITFFSTSDEVCAANDLDMKILKAILSDCDKTIEAIDLAVRWKEPVTIRNQLEDTKEADPDGLARAFMRALVSEDPQVLEALIQFPVVSERPENLRMDELWCDMDQAKPMSDRANKFEEAFVSIKLAAKLLEDGSDGPTPSFGRQRSVSRPSAPFSCSAALLRLCCARTSAQVEEGPNVELDPLFKLPLCQYDQHLQARQVLNRASARELSGGELSYSAVAAFKPADVDKWLVITRDGSGAPTVKVDGVVRQVQWQGAAPEIKGYIQSIDASMDRTITVGPSRTPSKGDARGGTPTALLRAIENPRLGPKPEPDRPRRTWVDIFMWTVVKDEIDMARVIWQKVDEPLRAAIMAARVCQWMAAGDTTQIGDSRREAALKYEQMAIDLLDEANNIEQARSWLTVISRGKDIDGKRVRLWQRSVLDEVHA
jgi:hypothetical protein